MTGKFWRSRGISNSNCFLSRICTYDNNQEFAASPRWLARLALLRTVSKMY